MRPTVSAFILGVFFLFSRDPAGAGEIYVILDHPVSSASERAAFRFQTSNKIVTAAGRTHVTYLEHDFDVKILSFDHISRTWSKKVRLGTNIRDNHVGPALAIDEVGFLHAVFGAHSETPFKYLSSTTPWSSQKWSTITSVGHNATYPSLVADRNGTLHLAYRRKTNDYKFNLVYHYKMKGQGWSPAIELIEVIENYENLYAHFQHSLFLSEDGDLHVLFNLHVGQRNLARSQRVGHLKSKILDSGVWSYGGSWTTIEESPVEIPISPTSTGGAIVYEVNDDGGMKAISISGVAIDGKGNPWFVVKEEMIIKFIADDGMPKYKAIDQKQYLFTHGAGGWAKKNILKDLAPPEVRSLGSSTLSISVSAENTVYLLGEINGGVGLMYGSDFGNSRLTYLPIAPKHQERAYFGANIERPTNQNSIGIPWVVYAFCIWNDKAEKWEDCHAQAAELGRR